MSSSSTGASWLPFDGTAFAIPIIVAGLAFAGAELLHMQAMSNPLGVALEAVLPFVGALGLAGLGYVLWSERYGYEAAQAPRVAGWVAVGMIGMALVFLWVLAHQLIRGAPLHHAHFLAVNTLVVGGLAGFLIGTYDARSKASQRTVERERNKHAFLEHMLRHHILNGMNVILGQTERLANDGDADAGALSLIETHGEEIVDRIEHVRTISRSAADDGAPRLSDQDLPDVVRRVVQRARERHPQATIDCSIEAGPTVRADEYLSMVVENLVTNAVEHNDSSNPTVEVTVDADDDGAVLAVVDDGPGIPAEQRRSLLDWEAASGTVGGLGVGLAIVKVLADRYDGDVDLRPLEPTGTEAVMSLQRAD